MGTLRAPRAYLQASGVNIPCLSIDVTTHRQKSSDTWSAEFSMSALGVDVSYWANTDEIDVVIVGTNDITSGGMTTLLTGATDKISFNWAERTISASGRDQSKKMMDSKSQDNFKNQKSSDIVKTIAQKHGFQVESDDSDQAGRQYTEDLDEVTDAQSDWQTICALAEREGKVVFFKGDTIYFKDPDNLDEGAGSISITYSAPTPKDFATGNFVNLETSRNCQVSKPTKVSVKSWHPHKKAAVTATEESGGGTGDMTEYAYEIPRLSQDQAGKIAKKKLKAHTDHAMTVSLSDLPADVDVSPLMSLSLDGTGTDFDTSYDIDSISFHFRNDEATMDLSTKAPKAKGKKGK